MTPFMQKKSKTGICSIKRHPKLKERRNGMTEIGQPPQKKNNRGKPELDIAVPWERQGIFQAEKTLNKRGKK
jgi:hypothetical protein